MLSMYECIIIVEVLNHNVKMTHPLKSNVSSFLCDGLEKGQTQRLTAPSTDQAGPPDQFLHHHLQDTFQLTLLSPSIT